MSSEPRALSPQQLKHVYLLQQIFVFGFGIAMCLIGLVSLIYPSLDLTLTTFPSWLRFLDHAGYLFGGAFLVIGIKRTLPRLEAAGHITIAGLFLAILAPSIAVAPTFGVALSSVASLVPLALGSAARCYVLLRDLDGSR